MDHRHPARAVTRPRNAQKVEWDERHGLWKINPLADWSEKDVWRRIHERSLPYHPLHDQGYASIGCTHCTRPGAGREGRWAGSDKTECGLHAGASAPRKRAQQQLARALELVERRVADTAHAASRLSQG